jgi:ADP-heptose:LPS heptosyltransferase
MGDVAMTIPVLKVFSKTYPQVKLTVITKPFFKPLFNLIPNCNVLEADVFAKHKGVLGILKLAREANQLNIDLVADLHGVIRSKIITAFLLIKGATIASINKGRSEKKALTRAKNKIFKPLKTTTQRYAEVFNKLGFPIDLNTFVPETKKPIPEAYSKAFDFNKKLIGIAPFAAHEGKMYPLHLVRQVIAALAEKDTYQILLFGGGIKEKEILDTLSKSYKNTLNVTGTLTFKEELDLISNLDVMVSMDSGNGHLAAIFGVPVVSIWGVTHPYAGFAPFKQKPENNILPDLQKYPEIPTSVYGNTYPESYKKAMESIPAKKIVDRVEKILN